MGKILRGAHMSGLAYTVAVPEVHSEPVRANARELDERFAAPQDALNFDEPEPASLDFEPEAEGSEQRIDWEQTQADARALIDRAAADGEALLNESGRAAHELLAQAKAQTAIIETQARSRGHDEGVSAGRSAIEGEMAEMVAMLGQVVEEARGQRSAIVAGAEVELVKLAMSIAERVVHEHIALDPTVIVENVRHALTRLVTRDVVTLRVNPLDLETIRRHRDALSSSSDVEHLRVIEDQRVDRGGVIVETEAGTIDAKISTQLREARRVLQTGDAIAISSSSEPVTLSSAQAS